MSTLTLLKVDPYHATYVLPEPGIIMDCSKNIALSRLDFTADKKVTTATTNQTFANAIYVGDKCATACRFYAGPSGPMDLAFTCGGSGILGIKHTGKLPGGQDVSIGSLGMHVLYAAAKAVAYRSVDYPGEVFNGPLSASNAVSNAWKNALVSMLNSTACQNALLACVSSEVPQGSLSYTFSVASPNIILCLKMIDVSFSLWAAGDQAYKPMVLKEIPLYVILQ